MKPVTDEKLSYLTGLTVDALKKYRAQGKVSCPKHYWKATNGRIMWDTEAFFEWLEESRYSKAVSGSGSSGKASASMKRQSSDQQLAV